MTNTNNAAARVQLTLEAAALDNLHIVRRNAGKGVCQLVLSGQVVGTAQATYATESQRHWAAHFDADVNGAEVKLDINHVFSAVRITKAFEDHLKFLVSEGKLGADLNSVKGGLATYKLPKPVETPASTDGQEGQAPKAEGGEGGSTEGGESQAPAEPAAQVAPEGEKGKKGSKK